ncbi:MAG: NAD(P)/FAD-dependent oxidoreductase [Betaproteobacteria bacterium]
MKIAVVGSGISGLSAAWQLSCDGHEVSLFEAGDYFGGHTNTVDVDVDGQRFGVDTGFLVFNHRTYPNLVRLFEQLKVHTSASNMSFAVKMPMSSSVGARTLEWAGSNLDTVFAQRRNLLSPRFWRMLRDIMRFNHQTTEMALTAGAMDEIPLGEFLDAHRYSAEFRDWYLLPMAGCIWSCPTEQMLAFPLATFVRFCHNHGLIQVSNRPQWHTVTGGARHYVQKMLEAISQRYLNTPVTSVRRVPLGTSYQVRIESSRGVQLFDHAVLAAHSDQSLQLLHDASDTERAVLSAVGYQPNQAVLHTDARCLPESRKTWSAWNYESTGPGESRVCVHYLLNKLQPLPVKSPVIVSLNPIHAPDPAKVLARFDYAHPVFDGPAVNAQQKLLALQGTRNTWFAGAWTGYGFHEDGLKSGLSVAAAIAALADAPVKQAA